MDSLQTLERACQLIRLGQLESALREASAVLSAEPDNSKAKGVVALCHLRADRHDEAQEMARAALALNPCEQGAHYVLAESMFAQRSLSDAEHHIREAMSLRPNYTPFHLLLGKICLRTNRAKQTIEQADSMLRIDPSNAEAFMLRACARFELGKRLTKRILTAGLT